MFQYVVGQDACVQRNPFPGVRMFITEAEKMTLSIVDLEPHAVIPEHSHPHEQIGYMVEGEAEFVVSGQSSRVQAGEMWRLPGGVPHKVVTRERPMRAVDVFYPVREDMKR